MWNISLDYKVFFKNVITSGRLYGKNMPFIWKKPEVRHPEVA